MTAGHTKCPLRMVAYVLQESLGIVRQTTKVINNSASRHVYETSGWCNSFVLVPKANEKVHLCLEPARLNKALIKPIHRGPKLNDILLGLASVKCLKLIYESSGYIYLRLDEKSSYLTTFPCPFGMLKYLTLPFRAATA